MEMSSSVKISKIPQHLQPFLRPSFATEPKITETSHPHSCAQYKSPTSTVELCPPHWRLPPKRSLRTKVKLILLKDWQSLALRTPHRNTTYQRPPMMRMKDSDDYITARAANPRTGLISPSIGSNTPRPPITPSSPAEALQRVKDGSPASPTPEAKARPALRRANEGRKLSDGNATRWRMDRNGWLTENAVSASSPKVTDANVSVGVGPLKSQTLHDDDLVVHMPSAHEPQPYAYPGYSTRQIEAFEHYKRKARRVSGEGYDQRLLHSACQASGGSTITPYDRIGYSESLNKPALSADASNTAQPRRDVTVIKRRLGGCSMNHPVNEGYCMAGVDSNAAKFAPYASPKTPAMHPKKEGVSTLAVAPRVTGLRDAGAFHIQRKPLSSNRQQQFNPANDVKLHGAHGNTRNSEQASPFNKHNVASEPDLRRLPRIALVHPSRAGLPQEHLHGQVADHTGSRKCSLGCLPDQNGGSCIERRFASFGNAQLTKRTLFDVSGTTSSRDHAKEFSGNPTRTQKRAQQSPQLLEIVVTGVIGLLDACRHVSAPSLPRIGVVEVLKADDTTPRQKADALKTILSSAGQALIFLTVAAMVWQVGSAVVNVFEMVMWPLAIPFKIMRWLSAND